MGLDHSNAFVRIWFDGLIAFCFNRRRDNCEMGMVQVADHEPRLVITRIHPNGTESEMVNRALGAQDGVAIEAENPSERGVFTFPRTLRPSEFDRVADDADPEDFRWIIDLQGGEFHGNKLKLKQGGGDELLRPKITIPHGIFYTADKSPSRYLRFRRNHGGQKTPLGKIADRAGADIVCLPEGGRVRVTVGSESPLTLLRDTDEGTGFRYWIEVTNLCRGGGSACPAESDFPHYYKAARDDDGVEYDLEEIFPPGDARGKTPVEDVPEFPGFRKNGPPQVCNSTFLGQTESLP